MIERRPFGSTGFESSRILFGAAALAGMKPARAEATLETLEEFGINHIDTAASYGDSELNLASWLRANRSRVFLATKTGDRDGPAARKSLERSLERMGVDQLDSIQLHNLTDEPGWQTAMGPGGAVEALIQARDEGLVRFIGVTGHGTYAPAFHLRSLAEFEFASVLTPYNFSMMSNPEYAADFEALETLCEERGVALQTIKSIARRRWPDGVGAGIVESAKKTGNEVAPAVPEPPTAPRFSWYEPLQDVDALSRAVRWALARDSVFLNSSSDGRLLRPMLEAAARFESDRAAPELAAMHADISSMGIEPLFVRDISDSI